MTMTQHRFVSELARLRPSSTFLSVMGYRNSAGEIADFSLAFNFSYRNALLRSLVALAEVEPKDSLQEKALKELRESFQSSLDWMEVSPIEEREDGYTRFQDDNGNYVKGVKFHDASQTLHLFGLLVHKRVLMPGDYKKTRRQELTIAKDELRKLCPVARFRQFKLTPDQVDQISVQGLHLLPPGAELLKD